MKIMLMVAAGIAVGLTVAIAVLIQILEQLLPLLLVVALVMIVLRLVRRRGPGRPEVEAFPLPAAQVVAPPSGAPALPSGVRDLEAPYLRWGPPVHEDLDAAPATFGAGTHLRRSRASAHRSRPAGDHRP